jgi:DNA-binding winged helix-turn-helix (wHTH) protein
MLGGMSEEPLALLRLHGGAVDLRRRRGHRGEHTFRLTETEASLLGYLAQRPGQPVEKAELMQAVWGWSPQVMSRAVDTAVRRLRRKLGDGSHGPAQILTARGSGYLFQPVPDEALPSPRPPQRLWGREALIERLSRALDEDMVVLSGPPGVGKTALAATLARRTARRVGWVDGSRLEGLHEVLLRALRALQEGDQPALLVVDGAEELGAQGWALLASVEGPVQRLVTARIRPEPARGINVPVPPLPLEVGAEMLRVRAAVPDPEALDPALVRRLVAAVGGLPLGIALVAQALDAVPAEVLAHRLEREAPSELSAAIGEAVDLLPAHARWALVHCLVFAGSFPPLAAQRVLEVEEEVLTALVRASLLEPDPDAMGRLRVLAPVASALRGRFEASPDAGRVRGAHRRYHADRARAVLAQEGPRAIEQLEDELLELDAAARAGPLDEDGLALVHCLVQASRMRGVGEGLAQLVEQEPAAVPPEAVCRLLLDRAQVRACVGREDAAEAMREAAAHARAHGLEARELDARSELALFLLAIAGPTPEIEASVAWGLAQAERLPADAPEAIKARFAGATLAMRLLQHASAERQLESLLEPLRRTEDLHGESLALGTLGVLAGQRGEPGRAVRLLQDASRIAELYGHAVMSMRHQLLRLAWLCTEPGAAGEVQAELDALEARARRLGYPRLRPDIELARGLSYLVEGRLGEAGALLEGARQSLLQVGELRSATLAAGLLGVCAHERGSLIEACAWYQRAADEASAMGANSHEAMWSAHLGLAHQLRGELEMAAQARARADRHAHQLGPAARSVLLHCARPGLAQGPDFRGLQWWPALARILSRATSATAGDGA